MERISTGSTWEAKVGYSRAVVSEGLVFVSAMAAIDEKGVVVGKGDPYAQTRAILDKLGAVLGQAGSSLDRVVQTRLYVTEIAHWQEVGRAHREVFASRRPALSLIHVKPFLDPDMLVEVEAVAALVE